MTDQTITLSYEERSTLLTILNVARAEISARYPEHLETLEAIVQRVSRLECQPGGCSYCNADRAREEDERYEETYCPRCAMPQVGKAAQWPDCKCPNTD